MKIIIIALSLLIQVNFAIANCHYRAGIDRQILECTASAQGKIPQDPRVHEKLFGQTATAFQAHPDSSRCQSYERIRQAQPYFCDPEASCLSYRVFDRYSCE